MKSINFPALLLELVNEPVKINLWWIILRNPGITAKELKKRVNLEGNSIYYYLAQLEKLQLVDTSIEAIPNSNLSRKKYSISKYFLESRQDGIIAKELSGQEKEILLYELLMMNSLEYQTIQNIKPMSKKDFNDQRIIKHAPFGELLLINAEDVERVKNIFEELQTIAKKSSLDFDLQLSSQMTTHGVIFACIPLVS